MPERTGGDKGRLVNIGKRGFVVDVINHVIEHRKNNSFGIIKNTGMYCGLESETCFFLNSKGEPFKLKKNASDNYQPYELRRHLKSLNLGEGIDMQIALRSIGNSIGGIIPKTMLENLGLKKGDKVDITEENGRLVIEPIKKPEYSLNELLAQCDNKATALNDEDKAWLNAEPVGKEVL